KAHRLIDRDADLRWRATRLSHLDRLATLNLAPRLDHDRAIDAHQPVRDQLFSLAARANALAGEPFIDPLRFRAIIGFAPRHRRLLAAGVTYLQCAQTA